MAIKKEIDYFDFPEWPEEEKEKLWDLANVLHALYCDFKHGDNILDLVKQRRVGVCYYFLERTLSNWKDQKDNKIWLDEAEKLCEKIKLSPSESLVFIKELCELKGSFERLIQKYPTALELAGSFLVSKL